jgi:hypothetical protein
VLHGLSIPGLGVNIGEIYPGKVVEVEIMPRHPGRYAFACIRWCSVDHWRMRGVIEVEGPAAEALPTEPPPLYEQLVSTSMRCRQPCRPPASRPAAATRWKARRGTPHRWPISRARRASLGLRHSDAGNDPANRRLSDGDIWNLVAWAWLKDEGRRPGAGGGAVQPGLCGLSRRRREGRRLVGDLPGMSKMDPAMRKGPADFTDPVQHLAQSDVLLQGKLLRGGMGTGMPEFGSLYTDEELWAMVSYLRTFLFDR